MVSDMSEGISFLHSVHSAALPLRPFGYSCSDHTISRHQLGQLFLAQIFRILRTHRYHDIAQIGGAIVHANLCFVGDVRAEFGEHDSGFADHAGTVGARFVPARGFAQQTDRVARAERADQDIVQVGGVGHGDYGGRADVHVEFGGGGIDIFAYAFGEGWVGPAARDQTSAVGWGLGGPIV